MAEWSKLRWAKEEHNGMILGVAGIVLSLCVHLAAAELPQTVLELVPSEGNPRNSEGAFAQMADGRILFAYSKYVGQSRGDGAQCVIAVRSSGDLGKTWSDDRIIARNSVEPNGNVMSVSFLSLESRRLAMFYLQKESGEGRKALSRILMKESDDGGETWSDSVDCSGLALPPDYYVLNNDRAVRLKSGRVVLPLAYGASTGIVCLFSDDECRTWAASARVECPVVKSGKPIRFEEPGLFERKDGSVVLYLRTNSGRQWHAVSSDGCATWGHCTPWMFVSPRAPMSVARLRDGRLLAVWNDHSRFPERREGKPKFLLGPRTPLTLAVSADEGETWGDGKDLETDYDDRDAVRFWFCYTAVLELDDRLLLAYCAEDNLRKLRIKSVPKAWLPAASGSIYSQAGACAEEFLWAARKEYDTAPYSAYTNTLVRDFCRQRTKGRADIPLPGGTVRWWNVEGMRNVRDIGGWTGLAIGRAFRGSEPDCLSAEIMSKNGKKHHGLGITERGLEVLRRQMKIRTDLDLRKDEECPHPAFSAFGSDVQLVRVPLESYENAFEQTNLYAQALRVFADPKNYPIYFHCWGGADRTGTLALLLEGLCGADETDVVIDYELTSFAQVFGMRVRTEDDCLSRIAAVVRRLKTYPGRTFAEQIASYMRNTLGLTRSEIDAIRSQFRTEH